MSVVLKNVTKIYKNNVVLDKFNLEIKNAKLYLFIGSNGSGKSTCLKLISNQILYKNNLYSYIKGDFLKINYMPEKFSLPKLLTVDEYLSLYLNLESSNKKLRKTLKKYAIPNIRINKLSKGTIQKVIIISMILSDGDLYVFDEPLDGLDTSSKRLFFSDIKSLLVNNKTVLISTHNKELYTDLNPEIIRFGDLNEKE